ncbi:glycosyltransferase [Candidatus Bathyarchaeota archaeon]|nr:glycosyltransferase [Candidatus Bathyarchaeota archaeon]
MKILQVIPYFPPAYAFGGPVQVAYQISRQLAKKGHEVIVYTSDAKDFATRLTSINPCKELDGFKVYYLRNISMLSVKYFKFFITPDLYQVAKREIKTFDIIHLHEYRTFQNIVIYRFAKKYGVPYVLQAHGSLPRIGSWRKLKWVYDTLYGYKLLRSAAKVIAVTSFEAEQYRNFGIPVDKIAIIPNGINLAEYANLPPQGCFKRKYNIPEEKRVILYLGRLHRVKGVDILLKAYAYLRNKVKKANDTVLVIVGPDDGFFTEAKYLASALGISNAVLFTGSLYGRSKLEALVDAEFLVIPSRYETFPYVLLEAYACGKPVIAANVGGLSSLVIEGVTGTLFETGNFKQLADKMFQLLNDEYLIKEMGAKAIRLVKEKYSIEKIALQTEKLYSELF